MIETAKRGLSLLNSRLKPVCAVSLGFILRQLLLSLRESVAQVIYLRPSLNQPYVRLSVFLTKVLTRSIQRLYRPRCVLKELRCVDFRLELDHFGYLELRLVFVQNDGVQSR